MNHHISTETVGFFRWHICYHLTEKLHAMMKFLDEEESVLFNVDMRKYNQVTHAKLFNYGIGKYFFGFDLLSPLDDLK